MDGWTFRREQRGDPGLAGHSDRRAVGHGDGRRPGDGRGRVVPLASVSFLDVVSVVRRLCEAARDLTLASARPG